jgi:hypothetical protein
MLIKIDPTTDWELFNQRDIFYAIYIILLQQIANYYRD